ncbi:MAG: alpha-L-rhamnosidase C-terminal domain-containing protein, partial [Eubacteriales bacterium]
GVAQGDTADVVLGYISANAYEAGAALWPYTHRFLFNALYRRDTAEDDSAAVALMKRSFGENFEENNPGYATRERFGPGSRQFHCFGIVPAYFMSAYILGVRRSGDIGRREIIIEPHLGGLAQASGAVATELGVVRTGWNDSADRFEFSLDIPCNVQAELALPLDITRAAALTVNGQPASCTVRGRRAVIQLGQGKYSGALEYVK